MCGLHVSNDFRRSPRNRSETESADLLKGTQAAIRAGKANVCCMASDCRLEVNAVVVGERSRGNRIGQHDDHRSGHVFDVDLDGVATADIYRSRARIAANRSASAQGDAGVIIQIEREGSARGNSIVSQESASRTKGRRASRRVLQNESRSISPSHFHILVDEGG
ncbi:hypothetical protein SDC9_164701 [bioreactor metagenome]|uniref:Uncharacterized protein n=1 Tax=bioreactor metagenome TaxID=1076179 RepID=A0A645FSA9_9ZZZZ